LADRRTFLRTLAGGAVAGPLAAAAQTARPPLVGYLGPPESVGPFLHEFQRGLADHGYAEGRNVHVEYRYNVAVEGNHDRLTELANELVRLRPDVLVVSLAEVALAARQATTTIPIVMANVADPVASGLVQSLSRPGGNVTGVSRQTPELVAKQIQLLKEALPKTARVGLLVDAPERVRPIIVGVVKETADSLGVRSTVLAPTTTAEIDAAFVKLRTEQADAVLVLGGGVFFLTRVKIAELAEKTRLASMFEFREAVHAGGLISYGASSAANYRRAAYFVDRILKGAKPAELPVEQPSAFELVVNLRTARSLGIAIPQSILVRADEVIA
jgi:putative ABC transport system substrate-binding protein